jgi:hypothetical protein
MFQLAEIFKNTKESESNAPRGIHLIFFANFSHDNFFISLQLAFSEGIKGKMS